LGEIFIQGLKFSERRISNFIEVSGELKRFIKSSKMFVEYDVEIYADESILNIPLTSTVLPLAWLTGSNIHVDRLDRTFKESMDRIQYYFKDMYPLVPFTTEIKAEELIDNKIEVEDSERRTGLLFSGGIDSTYSMLSNLQYKPRLIMHWGVERTPYPVFKDYWNMVIDRYTMLTDRLGLTFNITKTNALEILHQRMIEHEFHKELFHGSFWVRLQHSFVMLPLTAPLSVNRFDQLLIAASGWSESKERKQRDPKYMYNPYPQVAETDEKIAWASLNVKHDGYIERYKKTRIIAEYFKNEGVMLRVCLNRNDAPNSFNCNHCEKCYRTIAQLVQAEVDPNNFGFMVDDSIWDDMKSYYIHKKELQHSDANTQKMIPDVVEFDLYGSKKYFEWLRNFKSSKKDVWIYRDIYDFLPYSLAKVVNEIYRIFKIDIHEDPTPTLPQHKIDYLAELISEVHPNWENNRTN
jgi:hypothetical protein